MVAMGVCTGLSTFTTGLGVAGTSLVLLAKWSHALIGSASINSTLLFMTVYGIASVLLMYLRTSATLKAYGAHQVLSEEIVDV